jgi:hypothetical protein
MRDAGLIPANLILEPAAAELQEHAGQPDVIAHLWTSCWTTFVAVLSLNPAGPIPNPLAFKSERRESVVVGKTNKDDWRIRAENFAVVCDELAGKVAGVSDQIGSAEIATKGQGNEAGDDPSAAVHSPDFRSVGWFGTVHSFTAGQARVVETLWNAWEQGTPDVGDETLLKAVDHEAPPASLRNLFRNHPAWGTMIVSGGSKGAHRLAEPEIV